MSRKIRILTAILVCVIFVGILPMLTASAEQDMWSNANSYMADSLREAQTNGLIPEILNDADFTQPMTRVEFAHLIVRMLETYTGVTAQPQTLVYPFKDTEDPIVFKAFGFGIMDRTDDKEALFSPDEIIDRETMAYMVLRAVRLVAPLADYSISESIEIPDIDSISDWAEQSVKYLYSHGIILGGNNHVFMPRPVTDEQKAANYGMATREQCVVVVNRIYKMLPEIQSSRFAVEDMADEIMNYAIEEPQGGEEISRDDLWDILNPYSLKVRWADNTHALSFNGDFTKTEDGDWEKGYDSYFLYNAFSADGLDQYKFDEQQILWGSLAGNEYFALTVFEADTKMIHAYEWNSESDEGALVNIPAQRAGLWDNSTLRNYMPSRIDWTYKIFDDAIINGERCKVFSVTTSENMIQGEGPNLPEHWADKTEYFYISTVSGLNVLTTNYMTLHETTYLTVNIVFAISPSFTNASLIKPPADIIFNQ
ncbi:MAG: S-layer homology domain-containing protein [Oscillospiraceae bacterium]|nr:S-layer homology domain-containing protein [Oscillospiraceae bacterium]